MCKTGTWYHGDDTVDTIDSSESTIKPKLENDDVITTLIDVSSIAHLNYLICI